MKGLNSMNQNKEADLTSIIVGGVCIIMAFTGGLSMFQTNIPSQRMAGRRVCVDWGICVALFAVIINEIISLIKRH